MDHRGNEADSGYSDFTEIATPGSNPASGGLRFYSKSDDFFYTLNSAGQELKVGSGGLEIVSYKLTTGNSTAGTATLDLQFSMSVAVATDQWVIKNIVMERLV